MKGKPVIVLKVGPELNTVLELFIQDLPNGVCGNTGFQARGVFDPLIIETLHVVVPVKSETCQ
eukprot:8912723-Alexandrium_andersonii.AAC.1